MTKVEIINNMPLKRESIPALLTAIVELRAAKRGCKSNKKSIKWMSKWHQSFEDNTEFMSSTRDQIDYYIDLCRKKIEEIKLFTK